MGDIREVGRVTGSPHRSFGGFPRKASVLRVAAVGDRVALNIGTEGVHLDAAQREEFSRLYFEAERQAEAGDDH